jgi:glutathione S-transferase
MLTPMQLYGTVTSPYVRRVRIVAALLGVDVTRVDTAGAEGLAALAAVSPIGKVPTAVIDGQVVFDSRVIIAALLTRHGPGPLRVTSTERRIEGENLVNAIDEALGAGIRCFYMQRDGIATDGIPYMKKERARIDTILAWLEARLVDGGLGLGDGLGLEEIALVSALGWMSFRGVVDLAPYPGLRAFHACWDAHPVVAATRPFA